jgi:hypothetical protein
VEYPVAYCAPGRKAITAITLLLLGEEVRTIIEHNWFKPDSEIMIVRVRPEFPLPPFEYDWKEPCDSSTHYRAGLPRLS